MEMLMYCTLVTCGVAKQPLYGAVIHATLSLERTLIGCSVGAFPLDLVGTQLLCGS